ncbi:MAG: YIP1 family protein [Ignavibacteriales bacterium]|nr:YIP1 family protein [Ignavibacteriales bacterium]
MEEMQNQEAPKMSSVENEHEEFELSHTDKLVGVFSEPGTTFAKTAKFPPKTSDWVIPVLVLIVMIILSQLVMRTNPEIKREMRDKQIAAVQKNLDESVAKGQMTRAQADERLNTMEEAMESTGTIQTVGLIIGTPIFVFIVFFVVAGFYMLVTKFGLKGTGTYKDAMVAYGLPYYIAAISVIVMTIAALAMNKFITGVSVADFVGSDKTTMTGFLLGKLDVFSIWFYVVFGIGLAKMNKSGDTQKYIITVFAIWIIFGLLFHFVAKAVPFLAGFAG